MFFGREGGDGDSTSVREKSVLENDSSEDESSDLFMEDISSADECILEAYRPTLECRDSSLW